MYVLQAYNACYKCTIPATVNSRCDDIRCKDNLDVRTMVFVSNHYFLTAVVPQYGQFDERTEFLVTKAVLIRSIYCTAIFRS